MSEKIIFSAIACYNYPLEIWIEDEIELWNAMQEFERKVREESYR